MSTPNGVPVSESDGATAFGPSPALALDLEREGDVGDGSLVIQDEHGSLLHYAAPEITAGLRHMVARLQSQEKGGFPPRLALTSALSGEGVTFITRSLAAVLANDLDRRVCLVDLNWWAANAPSSASSRTGMAGLIAGDLELDDVLVHTVSPRLCIVPSGHATISERPVLAKSERLATVLDELGARFDHLLLDLPAVLKNGEALTLASHSEMCVLIVLHGATTESFVRAALADLSEQTVLGVIVNKVSTAIPERIRRLVAPL